MRTVVVTGGSRGIGAACVRAFSQDGWRVAFFYRASGEAARALAAETGALPVQADVTQSAGVDAACATVLHDFKHVDALVNNAGVALTARLQDVTDAQWRQVLDGNLTGAFNVTRALLPQMIAQGHGRIVNVASIWGMVGGSMETAYSAAKAGLIGLTKALAKEAGPSGITGERAGAGRDPYRHAGGIQRRNPAPDCAGNAAGPPVRTRGDCPRGAVAVRRRRGDGHRAGAVRERRQRDRIGDHVAAVTLYLRHVCYAHAVKVRCRYPGGGDRRGFYKERAG